MKGEKKEKMKKKNPDKTSIAILPSINTIFTPGARGGVAGKTWRGKNSLFIMKFSYENVFVILLSGLLLLNQHFINISILLG